MRIAQGKVVAGHIVLEGEELPEGCQVTVLVEDEDTVTLNSEDEAALLKAINEADKGELIDAETLLAQLH